MSIELSSHDFWKPNWITDFNQFHSEIVQFWLLNATPNWIWVFLCYKSDCSNFYTEMKLKTRGMKNYFQFSYYSLSVIEIAIERSRFTVKVECSWIWPNRSKLKTWEAFQRAISHVGTNKEHPHHQWARSMLTSFPWNVEVELI